MTCGNPGRHVQHQLGCIHQTLRVAMSFNKGHTTIARVEQLITLFKVVSIQNVPLLMSQLSKLVIS